MIKVCEDIFKNLPKEERNVTAAAPIITNWSQLASVIAGESHDSDLFISCISANKKPFPIVWWRNLKTLSQCSFSMKRIFHKIFDGNVIPVITSGYLKIRGDWLFKFEQYKSRSNASREKYYGELEIYMAKYPNFQLDPEDREGFDKCRNITLSWYCTNFERTNMPSELQMKTECHHLTFTRMDENAPHKRIIYTSFLISF